MHGTTCPTSMHRSATMNNSSSTCWPSCRLCSSSLSQALPLCSFLVRALCARSYQQQRWRVAAPPAEGGDPSKWSSSTQGDGHILQGGLVAAPVSACVVPVTQACLAVVGCRQHNALHAVSGLTQQGACMAAGISDVIASLAHLRPHILGAGDGQLLFVVSDAIRLWLGVSCAVGRRSASAAAGGLDSRNMRQPNLSLLPPLVPSRV